MTGPTPPVPGGVLRVAGAAGDRESRHLVAGHLGAWPSAGLAAGIVRDGRLEWFHGHGVADVDSGLPVTPDTVFRVGSITKTFTAIAVMQLRERGVLDLDAPASDYLRSFALIPASAGLRPVTVRHLLTHTAGIGYWRRLSDLLHPGIGSGDLGGRRARPLAEYYRPGLRVEVEPGTKWVYSNHGFAVLGQIVEDMTGEPIDRYLREHVFTPLGMLDTGLAASARMRSRIATGYVLRSRGLKAVADRDIPTRAAGGAYSTVADLARYAAALMRGGANEHGSVLRPGMLAAMFQPQFRADPRVAGTGLAFHLGDEGGHRTAGHDGILSGFLSALLVAPDDGVAVIVLRNTGRLDGRGAPEPLAGELLRRALGVTGDRNFPPRPEAWGRLCGWYGPVPGPVTNLFIRATMGAGVEVAVRGRQLVLLPLTPVPGMRHGLRLHADDPDDPWVLRADFAPLGYASRRVVFAGDGQAGTPATRLVMEDMVFERRPDSRNPRRLLYGLLTASGAALAVRRRRRRAVARGYGSGRERPDK